MHLVNKSKTLRGDLPRRLLLLLTARTYRAPSFVAAAERLGIEIIRVINMQPHLAEYWNYPLGLQYDHPEACVQTITEFAAKTPLGAIIAVDDSGTLVAAQASQALGLPHNSPESALAARDKYVMRQLLEQGGVRSPKYRRHHFTELNHSDQMSSIAADCDFPSVVKPIDLNGSRGVIRVDDPQQLVLAVQRLQRMLYAERQSDDASFLVEQYIPGFEVAVEGMLIDGRLKILALFDKPDPLDGPFFEETIYITPSRLDSELQHEVFQTTADATAALGLREGPVHAELRLNDAGAWLIELAGRSIGGLCSKTLRFGPGVSLEEMIIRQAFGMKVESLERERLARGVMMIPIPQAGLLKGIEGCDAAAAVRHIESVDITAQINHHLIPLPEGDSYLGFIFAKGPSPEAVEEALRSAHGALSFDIAPELPLISRNLELSTS